MRPIVIVDPPRLPLAEFEELEQFGTSTVHEVIGRKGYLGPTIRPVLQGSRIAGNALTVTCPPGDNLMAHVALDQVRPDDIMVVAPTSSCTDGYFREVFATALRQRGARGLVTDTGVRDVAELRAEGFPVWSRAVSAQGTVKATAGTVNLPVVIGTVIIFPGDVIVADDDGVVCVPRAEVAGAIQRSMERVAKEVANMKALRAGGNSVDLHGLRSRVDAAGILYTTRAKLAGEIQ